MNCLGLNNDSDEQNIHNKNSTVLPPINKSRDLKYQQNYGQVNNEKKKQQKREKDRLESLESSPISKSSSLYSSSISSIDSHQNSIKSLQQKNSQQYKKPQKNIYKMQSQEHEEYKDKSVTQITQEIKQMRRQFIQMNKKLSQMLNLYNMAKNQFIPKELLAPSKQQFYKVQIQTNRKVQQSQIIELKKLNETQLTVKDKDILLDLQKVLIEMRQQLHQAKKQQYDSKLKNHKQDVILQEIIKVNNQNKDNNKVKLLKLQIIYYMKKQNSLKTHQQQLQHQQKLITQNDKHLDQKVQQIKKNNKNYYLNDQNYLKIKEKYENLLMKKKNLMKQIQALKRSNEINQQKYAREMISLDNQYRNSIKPKTIKYQSQNQQLEEKINQLMSAYQLNQMNLKQISYRFSPQLIRKKNGSPSKIQRSILKPNLRPKSNFSNQGYTSVRGKQTKNTQSNEKILQTHRQNDKNMSVTIDVNLQNESRYRSISDTSNIMKPRNFRVMTKKDKDPNSNQDRNHTYSMTIDHSSTMNYITAVQENMKIQKPKMLKPKLLTGGNLTKR